MLTILERRNRGIGAGGLACLRRLEKSERHMTLSCVSKAFAAAVNLAKVSARIWYQQGAFGCFCLDRRPHGWRRSGHDRLSIKPMMSNSRDSRIESEQINQRGAISC